MSSLRWAIAPSIHLCKNLHEVCNVRLLFLSPRKEVYIKLPLIVENVNTMLNFRCQTWRFYFIMQFKDHETSEPFLIWILLLFLHNSFIFKFYRHKHNKRTFFCFRKNKLKWIDSGQKISADSKFKKLPIRPLQA